MEYYVLVKCPKGKRLNGYLKGIGGIPLKDKETAESVARYTKERYPDYEIRVVFQYVINL